MTRYYYQLPKNSGDAHIQALRRWGEDDRCSSPLERGWEARDAGYYHALWNHPQFPGITVRWAVTPSPGVPSTIRVVDDTGKTISEVVWVTTLHFTGND